MKDYKPAQHIKFRTRQQSRDHGLKKFTAVLLLVLFAGGAISVFAFFKNYNFKVSEAFGAGRDEEETTEYQTAEKLEKFETDILFMCADSDREHIYFMSLVHIQMPKNKITVYSFSPSDQAAYNGQTSTVAQIYYSGGAEALPDAVESCTGIRPDKYAVCSETAFRVIVDRYGGVTTDVPEDINYKSNDAVLVISKGSQTLNGDSALRYMRVLPQVNFTEGMEQQSAIIKALLTSALVPERSDGLMDRFSYFANLLTTDITVVDFSAVSDEVEAMMNSNKLTITAVTDIDDYPKG